MKHTLAMLCAVALLAGCSNGNKVAQGDGDPVADEPAAITAAVSDDAQEQSAANVTLYDILPDKAIIFSFPFTLRSDKTVVTDSGKTRRGASLEYHGIDAEQLWASLDTSFDNAGYTSAALDADASGRGSLKFSKDGAKALTITVAPDVAIADAGVVWIGWDVIPPSPASQ